MDSSDIINVYMDYSAITIKSEFTMEDIVSQLQPNVKNILCVKDGYELFIFKSPNMIPPNLRFGTITVNPITDQTQYYFYMNNVEEDCYCFFLRSVYEWLISGRQIPFNGVKPPHIVQGIDDQNFTTDSGVELSELIGTELTAETSIDETGAHKDVYSYQVRR